MKPPSLPAAAVASSYNILYDNIIYHNIPLTILQHIFIIYHDLMGLNIEL